MKTLCKARHTAILLTIAAIFACPTLPARAATITKADNLLPLSDPASWTSNTLPTAADIALFNNTLVANSNFSLGDNTIWAGIQLTNPAADITINDVGHTLILGGAGIDMSAATANLTLNGALTTSVTGTGVLNVNVATRLIINSAITITPATNGTILNKNGTGTLVLAGANRLAGVIALNAGVIQLASSNALTLSEVSSSPFTVAFAAPTVGFSNASATLDLAGHNAAVASIFNTGIITNTDLQASTLTLLAPNPNSVFSGSITNGAGGISLLVRATGTQILFGQNSYTGDTTLASGALNLAFNAAAAPLSNIISSASRLVLAGGALSMTPKGNQSISQSFNGTVVNPGASFLTDSSVVIDGNQALFLGNITRNPGGTVLFASQTGGPPGLAGIFSSTPVGPSGILGGWATVGLFDWAGKDANGNITALAPSAYSSATLGTSSFAPTLNTDMTTNLDLTAAAADLHTASLRFNAAAPTTLTLHGRNVIDSGGILVSSASASYSALITGGTGITSGNGQDLIVTTTNNAPLTIAAPIVDAGSPASTPIPIALTVKTSASLSTKSAYGQVTLTAPNTYSGGTFINGGQLIVAAGASLGTGPVSIIRRNDLGLSSLVLNDGVVLPNPITFHDDAAIAQFAVSTIDVAAGNSATLSGNITAPAEPRNQYRLGTSGGTLVVTGTHVAGAPNAPTGLYYTFFWGAANPNPVGGPPLGQVVFAANSSLTTYQAPIGMRAANLLLRDNASFTLISNSTGTGFTMGLGYIFGNYQGANILTLQDNASMNLGPLNFDLQNNLSFGPSTLNLNGGSITLGQFVKSAFVPATINFNGTTLIAAKDTAAFFPAFSGTAALVQSGGARINTNNHTITITQSLLHDPALASTPDGGLTKLGPGTLTFNSTANTFTGPLSIQQDAVALAAPVALKLQSLNIAHTNAGTSASYTAALQLNPGRAILQSTDPTDKAAKILALNEAIFAGHNGTANIWSNTQGITSAAVAADPSHLTIGVYDNSALHSLSDPGAPRTDWAGGTNNVDPNSLLITPALKGDANLDGIIDIADMIVVANNWNLAGKVNGISTIDMAHGDVNQDGVVDIADMVVVANNWNQTSSFNLLPSDPSPQNSEPFTATSLPIPEPASLALVFVATLTLASRRFRPSAPRESQHDVRGQSPAGGSLGTRIL